MRSTLFHRLAPALAFLSLLSACSPHPRTPSSLARTERPTLPTRPAELDRTERLEPLSSPDTGGLVAIARDALAELYARLAQAASAIERGNGRIGANKQLWTCVDAILRTGMTPAGCVATPPTAKKP